jgi:hypothetical protein
MPLGLLERRSKLTEVPRKNDYASFAYSRVCVDAMHSAVEREVENNMVKQRHLRRNICDVARVSIKLRYLWRFTLWRQASCPRPAPLLLAVNK